jgi:hypothetical protein
MVYGTHRGERLERGLDVDRQAGRAALVRLEGMPEPAVGVLVTAQGIDDPRRGLAEEATGEQAPFQQPCVVEQEAVSSRECIIHNPKLSRFACPHLEQNGHPSTPAAALFAATTEGHPDGSSGTPV